MERFLGFLANYQIVLASKSPRRQSLLQELGVPFILATDKEVDEAIPLDLSQDSVARFLAEKKAAAYTADLKLNDILITADTIVCLDDQILGKPGSELEAKEMLRALSGRKHQVITAVCLSMLDRSTCFTATTEVWFTSISDDDIEYYVSEFLPFDKAGAYGIQEWIGLIGIKRIEGSYFNVMGLPVQRLYDELQQFVKFSTK